MIDAVPVAATSSVVFIRVLARLAPKLGLVDHPDHRKQHEGTVPLVGGLAIGLSYLIAATLLLPDPLIRPVLEMGMIALMIVGAIDDRVAIKPRWRLLAQMAVAVAMIAFGGLQITSFGNLLGFGEVTLPQTLSIVLTLFFIVSLVNGFNMLDGLDGLAGGIGAVILVALCLAASSVGAIIPLAHMIIFLAALLGFLVLHNIRSPLRRKLVFLGDAGSTLLGFMLAWSAIRFAEDPAPSIYPISVVWVFGIVVLDTVATVVRRVAQGRSPFAPGRDHLHHLLLALGFSPQNAVWAMYAATAAMAGVGLAGWGLGIPEVWLTVSFVGLSLVYYAALDRAWRFVERSKRVTSVLELLPAPRGIELKKAGAHTRDKLSVITATFNSAATIGACIDSRRAMLGRSVRHLIQDGHSTDGTLEIIRQKDDGVIELVTSEDRGIYDALNKAIERVETDWLMFLHSDDRLTFGRILDDIALAELAGLRAISYGVTFCDSTGHVFRRWPVKSYWQESFRYGFMLPHTGLVVRRQLFEKYGLFRLDLGSAADYEWMLRAFYIGKEMPLLRPGEYLVQMLAGGASNSSVIARLVANQSDSIAWEVNGVRPSRLFRVLKPLRKAYQFVPLPSSQP